MDYDASLDETLFFEIPELAVAVRLCARLEPSWACWIHHRRDTPVVFVALNPDARDLAVLLRSVEAWVEEEALCAIRYEIDGRGYVLAAGEPVWSGDVAA
jgi:hypothetical protein